MLPATCGCPVFSERAAMSFNFGQKSNPNKSVQFQFGASTPAKEGSTTGDANNVGSNAQNSSTTPAGNPPSAFSFGNTAQQGFSAFGAQSSKPADTPASSPFGQQSSFGSQAFGSGAFGSSAAAGKEGTSDVGSKEGKKDAPSFSFGGAGNSLGASAQSSSTPSSNPPPSFSFKSAANEGSTAFGAQSSSTQQGTTPSSGAFGQQASSGSSPFGSGAFGSGAAPTFGSINTAAPPSSGVLASANSTGITFGQSSGDGKTETPKSSLFSIPNKNESKPSSDGKFSFGGGSTTNPASPFGGLSHSSGKPEPGTAQSSSSLSEKKDTPSFSFGQKDSAPLSTFGQKDEKKDTPSQSFGQEKKSDAPMFSFGNKDEKQADPSLPFGQSAQNNAQTSLFSAPQGTQQKDAPTFSFGQTEEKKENAPVQLEAKKNAPTFSFGQKDGKIETAPVLVEPKKDTPTFSFSQKDEKKEPAPVQSETKTDSPFSFGQKQSKVEPSSANASDEKKDAPSFSFGGASNNAVEKKDSSFSFGQKKEAPSDPGATSLFGKSSQLAPGESSLKNKTMEDLINKWTSELSKGQKQFKEQAEAISDWDRILIENGERISKLYAETVEAETIQGRLDGSLSYVESQQEELAALLDGYEAGVRELFETQLGGREAVQPADQEREKSYRQAEVLNSTLDQMGRDLSGLIDELNKASATLQKTGDADDPFGKIVEIMNSQLSSLQWVDEKAEDLQHRMNEIKSSIR